MDGSARRMDSNPHPFFRFSLSSSCTGQAPPTARELDAMQVRKIDGKPTRQEKSEFVSREEVDWNLFVLFISLCFFFLWYFFIPFF